MLKRIAGSYRDPSGHVFESDGRIFRTVSDRAAPDYEAARDAGILDSLVKRQHLTGYREVPSEEMAHDDDAYLLEHPRLEMISHPYEWSFSLLRDAALLHLDLHLELLSKGFTFSDASAYNIQFVGPKPVFIDHLSIRRYREGEFWVGHRQFCEQFLNPLLLRSLFGVPHNAWYRGQLEGIPVNDLANFLTLRHKLSWRTLVHVTMQARFQKGTSGASNSEVTGKIKQRRLPLSGLKAMLVQLRKWIAGMKPDRIGATVWGDYATTNTYATEEEAHKRQFIADFVKSAGPQSIIDFGCNTGEYSKVALQSGAQRALGFDFDQQALDRAHWRAKNEFLNFLPLFLDGKNPSPDQGWRQAERAGLSTRAKADAVMALAFEHHLAIAHNIPLDEVIGWIVASAPTGVLEFVPKSDPTVQKMLALREDIFPDYSQDEFTRILSSLCRIEKSETVSSTGRTLFAFSR